MTVEELFELEYERLVRSLGVAFDADAAADAVQEAFIRADRDWARVSALQNPATWVRRVAELVVDVDLSAFDVEDTTRDCV